jgi:hypothetical protein
MNAFHELYNDRLVAIDVEPKAGYAAVFGFRARCTDDDVFIFEEAWKPNADPSCGPTDEDTQAEPDWFHPGCVIRGPAAR